MKNRLLVSLLNRLGLVLFAFDPKDAADKKILDDAIADAISGLQSKNADLLTEVKKLKKGREIDPQTVTDLETENEKLTADLAIAQKTAKDATKAAETATNALKSESTAVARLLIDSGLVSELTKHGVTNPVHLKAAQAMLRGGVTIAADGENRVAKIGDKVLADAVKEWAGSDEGKFFVTAATNSGGGAAGGGGKPNGADLMKMPPIERMNAARAAPTK